MARGSRRGQGLGIGAPLLLGAVALSAFGVFDFAPQETASSGTPAQYRPGNAYHCSDFANYAQAKAYFDAVPGDPSKLDSDLDGKPCESLR